MKERKAGLLKKLKPSDSKIEKFVCVDTETRYKINEDNHQEHKLDEFYAILSVRPKGKKKGYKRKELRGNNYNEFWDFIEDNITSKKTLHIFAHNWNFDAMILGISKVIRERNWEILTYVNDSNSPFIMTIRIEKDKVIKLLDTSNYCGKVPLGVLGDDLGIPKLEMPSMETGTEEEWLNYVRRDTEIVEKYINTLLDLLDENKWGKLEVTASKQALTTFRTAFMNDKIYLHNNKDVLKMERESFYGGRTEVLRQGYFKGRVDELDYKSMYPSIMKRLKVPVKLIRTINKPSIEQLKNILDDGYCVIVRGEVEVFKPFLCNKGIVDGRETLLFPTGKIKRSFTTQEIKRVLEQGKILTLEKVAVYEGKQIFREYVDELFRLRSVYTNNGNKSMGDNCKLLLNALFGKFGQKTPVWQRIKDKTLEKQMLEMFSDGKEEWFSRENIEGTKETEEGIVFTKYRTRFGTVEEQKEEMEHHTAFTAIASHITAEGRLMIFDAMEIAGRENTFYIDTDSVHVNMEGKRRLLEAGLYCGDGNKPKLGELGRDNKADEVNYQLPKTYEMFYQGKNIKDKKKGIKSKAILIDEKDRIYEQDMFWSMNRMLKNGYEDSVIVEKVTKTAGSSKDYNKGKVDEEGYIKPFNTEEYETI